MMLSRPRWHVRSNIPNVLLNAFPNDLLPHNSVEQHIELHNNFLEVVVIVCVFFSNEEAVLLLEDVLDLADYVRSPDDLPVFLAVQRFFVEAFFETVEEVNGIGLSKSTE